MTLSENFKKQRQESKLSQVELAKKIGVTSQTVAQWESGEVEPEILNLKLLSEVFEISLDKLVTGHDYFSLPFKVGPSYSPWKALRDCLLLMILPQTTLLIYAANYGLKPSWLSLNLLLITIITVFLIYPKTTFFPTNNWLINQNGIKYHQQKKKASLWNRLLKFGFKPTATLLYTDIKKVNFTLLSSESHNNEPLPPLLTSGWAALGYLAKYQGQGHYLEVITKEGASYKLALMWDASHEKKVQQYYHEIAQFFRNKGISVGSNLAR